MILHFDTPSRRFYLSLIALIVHRMKEQGSQGYVDIRKDATLLKFLDESLSAANSSQNIEGMWEKIRKAWRYSLPKLEEAALFKILGRDQISPHEKGGKFRYNCSQYESDTWATLFHVDDVANIWCLRFAFDAVGLSLDNITLLYKGQEDDLAWKSFIDNLKITPEKQDKSALWLGAAALVAALLIGGVYLLKPFYRAEPITLTKTQVLPPSITVLPFVNMSDDPAYEYLCDGLTEELINSLARVKDLRVSSRTSSFYYKNKSCDLRTIGERLNVEHILEGSVRVSENRLRVACQLINAANDSHTWSESYDRELKDIFTLQEDLTKKILTSVHVETLGRGSIRDMSKGTQSLEAFLKYLEGIYYNRQWTHATGLKAEQLFLEAIEADPHYPTPHIWLAFLNLNKRVMGIAISPADALDQAFSWVNKGLALDPENIEGYLALGRAYQHSGKMEKAREAYRRCIELRPNYARGYFRLGRTYVISMQLEKAEQLFQKAIELDPLIFPRGLQVVYILKERYEDALAELKIQLSRFPRHPLLLWQTTVCYVAMGKEKRAQRYASRLMQVRPKFQISKFAKTKWFWDPTYLEKFCTLLRKAGVPE